MNNIFLKRREAIDKVIICAIIKIEKSFFHLSQMVLEAPNGKLSTTYFDQQLKNKNSSWYKEYSFMKCAAVADIDHNAYIESKDKDSLMRYVAEKGAGATITNKEINTLFPVTVIYDN